MTSYLIQFSRDSRDRIAEAHRRQGHEVIPTLDDLNQLWYIVQTDGRPTHLITSGGMSGEGFEYHLPADINPYLPFERLRGTATSCSRYA